jgi:hypothetical protein
MQERGRLGNSVSEDLVGWRYVMSASGASLTLPAVGTNLDCALLPRTKDLACMTVLLLDPVLFLNEYGLAFVGIRRFGGVLAHDLISGDHEFLVAILASLTS